MTRDIFFNLGRPKIRKYILKAPFLMCQYVTKMNINQRKQWLGKGPDTKLEEFLEKFQMDSDPPPLIFGKLYCKFFITDMVAYMQGGMMARWYEMHADALRHTMIFYLIWKERHFMCWMSFRVEDDKDLKKTHARIPHICHFFYTVKNFGE